MEELNSDKQKLIIKRLVSELASEEMDHYYTDSSTIANLIVEKIKSGGLNQEEKELVGNLSYEDVLVLMSYNSNCC